jgi:hypothetical protein
MKHTPCDCAPAAAASPLALRWRCPVCGKTAIMKLSTLAAVCDGDRLEGARLAPTGLSEKPA